MLIRNAESIRPVICAPHPPRLMACRPRDDGSSAPDAGPGDHPPNRAAAMTWPLGEPPRGSPRYRMTWSAPQLRSIRHTPGRSYRRVRAPWRGRAMVSACHAVLGWDSRWPSSACSRWPASSARWSLPERLPHAARELDQRVAWREPPG